MSRSDHSGGNCDSAADTKHARKLSGSIVFEEVSAETPPPASDLIGMLSHWPWPHARIDEAAINEAPAVAEDEASELLAAVDSARLIEERVVKRCANRNKAFWIAFVNVIVLKAVLDSVRHRALTNTIAETWTQGPDTIGLDNPKPDMAFGLAFEESGPLSRTTLHSLSTASQTRLVFSPTDLNNHILFPSLIYEGRPDSVIITQAEDEVAFAAARALGVLGELSELSEVPYQHCVVALVSSGALWRVHVAYQDLSVEPKVVSLTSVNRS